jgi:glycosyltransferase involved in cell wall biosynthesis
LYSYNRHWEEYFEKPFIIYEQLDELEVFDGFSMKKLKSQHEQLVQNSNLVVGISDQLVSKLRQTRPDTLLITNGVDINHFSKDRMTNVFLGDVMDYILSKGKPIIGYYGALARWMDYDLIRYVANELRNDCLFLFIGPPYDHSFARSKVGDLENIHVLPPVKYQILPEYLDKFTVATIPFVVNELTNSVSPLKLFEYMAGEKPIVTTKMKECEKYEGVIIAENKEDYVSKVLQAIELGSDEMYLESLRKVAYKNSWQNKTKQLMVEIKKRKG